MVKTNEKLVKALNDQIVDKCEKKGELHRPKLSNVHQNLISASESEFTQDAGKTECSTLQFGFIMSCLYKELFKLCPESKPDAECKEIKETMEKCPRLKPPLRQSLKQRVGNLKRDRLGEAMSEIIRDT